MSLSKSRPRSAPPNRCSHQTPTGRRCRLNATNSASGLCPGHASRASSSPASEDLSASFSAGLDEFMSAVQINAFLSQLAALVVQDRISPRRAAVLAYIQSLLLRTLPAIDLEQSDIDEDRPIFNLPRPGCRNQESFDSAISVSNSNDLNADHMPDTTLRNPQSETL
jgi:hypothetical protein